MHPHTPSPLARIIIHCVLLAAGDLTSLPFLLLLPFLNTYNAMPFDVLASLRLMMMTCYREEGKLLAIRQLIREGLRPPVLVFLQSKERARELFHELVYDGVRRREPITQYRQQL